MHRRDRTVKAGGDLVCMIRFDSQGGSEVQGYIALSGQTAEQPADPTRSGYIFGGWYKEAGCENPWSFESDTVTAHLTLYAKWTPFPAGRTSPPAVGPPVGTTMSPVLRLRQTPSSPKIRTAPSQKPPPTGGPGR